VRIRGSDIPLVLAVARTSVGVLLIARPARVLPRADRSAATSVLLMRTIGVRDLVLGTGGLWAWRRGTRADFLRWAVIGAASDTLDVMAGVAARGPVGRRGAATAVAVSTPWAIAGAVGVAARRGED
jgi:hypothetical protein